MFRRVLCSDFPITSTRSLLALIAPKAQHDVRRYSRLAQSMFKGPMYHEDLQLRILLQQCQPLCAAGESAHT